ncbi:DUF1232 domain-containing protein [bacterium]|nr:DUF1232 domain-containing protein [bacterium]
MSGFYDSVRGRLTAWAGKHLGAAAPAVTGLALLLPDILALTGRVLLDTRVPRSLRIKVAVVAAYLSSPLDLLPEGLLGPLGLLDDILLAAFAVNRILEEVEPEILAELWPGDPERLESLRELSAVVVGAFTARLGAGLTRWFGVHTHAAPEREHPGSSLSLISESRESEEDPVQRARAAGL